MDVYVAFTILYINVSPKGLSIVVLLPSSPFWAFGINLWFLIQPLWGFWEVLRPKLFRVP
jgi:hypothetical protein